MRNFLIACGMLLCAALGPAVPAMAQGQPMGVVTNCWDAVALAWKPCQLSPSLSIGNVGGFEFAVPSTPTVQNAAYAAGNAIGGKLTIAAFRTAGGSGGLNNISAWSKGGSLFSMTLYIFNADPTSSTCTDKVAFALNAADVAKLVAMIPPVLSPIVVGTGTTMSSASQQMPVNIVNGDSTQNLYACAVVGAGGVTPASTSDLVFKFSGWSD